MLASMVGEPERVTPAQMERWARAFDNWAVCDTATFVLWDRTPHAWPKVREWSQRKEEFVKRAAFAMLASLTVHDKQAPDDRYLEGLALIEREATDQRNFVRKAVNWALRAIGKRSPQLNKKAVALARRLADSKDPAPRWVGRDALRELTSPGGRATHRQTRGKTPVLTGDRIDISGLARGLSGSPPSQLMTISRTRASRSNALFTRFSYASVDFSPGAPHRRTQGGSAPFPRPHRLGRGSGREPGWKAPPSSPPLRLTYPHRQAPDSPVQNLHERVVHGPSRRL
jgi:hypothetical protein